MLTVHVVTFEGPGSSGFNWFYTADDADRVYALQQASYADLAERTKVTRFDVAVPEFADLSAGERQNEITDWLERHDVYGLADEVDESEEPSQRKTVGGG